MSFCLKCRSVEEVGAGGMPPCNMMLARFEKSG
jgi:hypothetical protein